jgi:acylphosphatase
MTSLYLLSSLLAVLAAVRTAADDKAKEPPKDAVARMVYYSGKVQGVGFRATVADIARDHPVTGWVKNLDDGRVQLLAEGKEEDVKKFLDAVRTQWKKNIEKEQVEEKKPTGEYKGFSIRY